MSKVHENNKEATSAVIDIPETKPTTNRTEINNNDNDHESSQQVVNEKDISNDEIVPLPKAKFILVFTGYIIFENYTWSDIFFIITE